MILCAECKKKYNMCAAGQAFTMFKCDLCKERRMHANTAVPKICYDCAEKEKVCQRCGKEIETVEVFERFKEHVAKTNARALFDNFLERHGVKKDKKR